MLDWHDQEFWFIKGPEIGGLQSVFPLRKFYTEQMFVLLSTKRMQLRNHADTQTVKRSQR